MTIAAIYKQRTPTDPKVNIFAGYFGNAFNFSGTTTRKEYWTQALVFAYAVPMVLVFGYYITVIVSIFGNATTYTSLESSEGFETSFLPLAGLYFAVMGLSWIIGFPVIAAGVRRLHDANLSGWLALTWLIPFAGAFLQIYQLVQASAHPDSSNRHLYFQTPYPVSSTPGYGSAPQGYYPPVQGAVPSQEYVQPPIEPENPYSP